MDEVDGKVEDLLPLAVGELVFHSSDIPFRLQVPATHSETAGKEGRGILGILEAGIVRVGKLFTPSAKTVFKARAEGGPDFPDQWKILGQRLVGTLEHGHALAPLEQVAKDIAREGAEHGHVDHANLQLALLAHVIGYRFSGPDQAALAGFLNAHFDVQILTSDLLPDTLEALRGRTVDLVLINRKLDADYSDGMEILTTIREDPALRDIPVMIISNFDDAQQAAVAAGAARGFGKAELSDPATRETVAAILAD